MKKLLLVTIVTVLSISASEARLIHRCTFPDGHKEMRECPNTWRGRPMAVRCHTWNENKFRHHGRCVTPG